MTGKPKDFLWCFLVGGCVGVVGEVIFSLLLAANVPYGVAIDLMLFILGVIGTILTVFNCYQPLEGLSGMGAISPFSGCITNIAETMSKSLSEGKSYSRAVVDALKGPLYIFGFGIMVCFIMSAGLTFISH